MLGETEVELDAVTLHETLADKLSVGDRVPDKVDETEDETVCVGVVVRVTLVLALALGDDVLVTERDVVCDALSEEL